MAGNKILKNNFAVKFQEINENLTFDNEICNLNITLETTFKVLFSLYYFLKG